MGLPAVSMDQLSQQAHLPSTQHDENIASMCVIKKLLKKLHECSTKYQIQLHECSTKYQIQTL